MSTFEIRSRRNYSTGQKDHVIEVLSAEETRQTPASSIAARRMAELEVELEEGYHCLYLRCPEVEIEWNATNFPPSTFDIPASQAMAEGDYEVAERLWIHAAAASLGHNRSARYEAAAHRCRELSKK